MCWYFPKSKKKAAQRRTYIIILFICISIFYLLQPCLGNTYPSNLERMVLMQKTGSSHYLFSLSCPYGTIDVSQQIAIFTRHKLVYNWYFHVQLCDSEASSVHELNTRQANDFHVPFSRLQVRRFSIKIHGSEVWNSFPTYIKKSTYVMDFKKKLR